MALGLELVVLRCGDVARSRAFYEALGLQFVAEQHGTGPAHLAATLADGVVVELYPASGQPTAPGRGSVGDVRLGFAVGFFEAVLDELADGGTVVPSPDGGQAVVTDPDGRRVVVTGGGRARG